MQAAGRGRMSLELATYLGHAVAPSPWLGDFGCRVRPSCSTYVWWPRMPPLCWKAAAISSAGRMLA